MKKIINFRVMVIFVLSILVASLTATYFFKSRNLFIIALIIFSALFLIFLSLSFFIKKKILYIFTIIMLLFGLIVTNTFVRFNNHAKYENFNSEQVEVYGRICENFSLEEGSNLKITLDNVYFIKNDEFVEVNGKFLLYFDAANKDMSKFEVGSYVSALARVKIYSFDASDKKSISNLSRDVVGYGSVQFNALSLEDEFYLSLKDKIKLSVSNFLQGLDANYSEIGYAMMFGDKTTLDSNINDVFKSTGIAHLLAISGLHISIIIFLLNFVLKKLKINRIVQFVILSVFIGFYSYLCDFSVSVVRAGLMALILSYANLRGKAYDNLSVLSLVAIILLLVNPLYIYNISFNLSFSAVLSIFLLHKPFTRGLSKVFHQKFAQALALNCSVQVGLLLTSAYYFNKINLLCIVCNFISVPVAIFSFVFLIIVGLVVAILPFMKFLLAIYSYLMKVVISFNYLISYQSLILYFSSFSVVFDLIFKGILFVISDYCFAEVQTKRVAVVVLIATILQVCLLI